MGVKTRTKIFLACISWAAFAGPGAAFANPAQALDNTSKICAGETARAERRMGVPKGLLAAISLAETGRWDENRRASFAWPWTVTAEGRGRYFDTKAEAIAEVEILMTEGVRNVDVGCMQVNLYYHGGAFETLEEAFDPRANATYAAAYLRNMYRAAGDWTRAAGYYHSMTPERNGPYREKVLAYWRGGEDAGGGETGARPVTGPVPVDRARMARLNARFKARRENARAETPTARHADALQTLRRRQLESWRDANDRGLGTQHLVAMRQAELALKRKRELDRLEKGTEVRFSDNRKQQLRDWRRRVAGTGTGTGTGTATSIAAAAAGAVVR